MHYRQIITYNFSVDDTRSLFEELLEENKYVKADDQSTYVLPYSRNLRVTEMVKKIVDWGKEVDMVEDDFVQIFYLTNINNGNKVFTKIASFFLKYDSETGGLK